MKQRGILVIFGVFMALMFFIPFSDPYSQAQSDPTRDRQTLDAIINPRRTMTARALSGQTATVEGFLTATAMVNQTAIAATATNYYTQTQIAQTATLTVTPSITPSPTLTSIGETAVFQTIIANVNDRLTRTAVVRQELTSTAAFQQTVDAVFYATLGITMTPLPAPSNTLPPTLEVTLNPTERLGTLIANAQLRLTQTAGAQKTVASQQTVDAIILGTLGITATPPYTSTPNSTEIQETLDARVSISLTQTPQAAIAQTGTAAFQGTISAITNNNLTATAIAIQATLTVGLDHIRVDNAAQIIELGSVTAHTAPIKTVAFNGRGDIFASGGLDNTVRLWNAQTLEQLFLWQGLTDRVTVAISPDGKRVAAGSSDGVIRLWDLETKEDIAALAGHTSAVTRIVFSPSGEYLASAGADRTVRLWSAANGREIRQFGNDRTYFASVTALAFTSNSALLGVGGQDSQIFLWEVSSGVLIARLRENHRVSDLAFSPDGQVMATVGNSSNIYLWNVVGANRRGTITAPFSFGPLLSVAFSLDGAVLAAGGLGSLIGLWNAGDGAPLMTLAGHEGAINSIAFSPDGARLLSASDDRMLRMWGIVIVPTQ